MSAPPAESAVLAISGVTKKYSALRPLRLQSLTIAAGERVALSGLDAAATELLVNLVTGASVPDQGEIRILGRRTADIASGDEWLASLDRFGIVSERAVLLEGSTLAQNLAMPFTLDIDPVQPEMLERVAALAQACGIAREWMEQTAGDLPPAIRTRAHLARAVALSPALLIVEHPTAALPLPEHAPLAALVAALADARRMATLVITMDEAFGLAAAERMFRLDAASGELRKVRKGWFR
jgi:ABC-type transporter Mla maintaining outer membrane lipid asymmetry ATPase subunit MlaF